jgi:hypothetical protein
MERIDIMKPHAQRLILTLGFLIFLAASAWAGYPRSWQMREVRQLAWQVRQNASQIEEIANQQRRWWGGRGYETTRRLQDFSSRAEAFLATVGRAWDDPSRTEIAYRDLSAAYGPARRAATMLRGGGDLDRATRSLENAMASLDSYYLDRAPGRGPHERGHAERSPYDRVIGTAAELQRLAENIDGRARAEVRGNRADGRTLDDALDKIDTLKDTARAFYSEASDGDRDREALRDRYESLARAYDRAQRRGWVFSPPVRGSLSRMGDQLALLDDLSPGYRDSLRRQGPPPRGDAPRPHDGGWR